MSRVIALTQREVMAYLVSPVAYLTAFAFLVMTGLLFTQQTLVPGQESTIGPLFGTMASIFVLCLPVLTMRLMADEYATGTIETLMTAPVTDAEVVLSKFLGVLAFYCLLLATTAVHITTMAKFADLDIGVTIVSYIGLLLLGGLYAAVGIFASACTRYQLVAALLGIGLLSALTFLTSYLSLAWPEARGVLSHVNVLGQFELFSRGVLDSAAVVYFLSGTALFLFLAVKVVESKRWR